MPAATTSDEKSEPIPIRLLAALPIFLAAMIPFVARFMFGDAFAGYGSALPAPTATVLDGRFAWAYAAVPLAAYLLASRLDAPARRRALLAAPYAAFLFVFAYCAVMLMLPFSSISLLTSDSDFSDPLTMAEHRRSLGTLPLHSSTPRPLPPPNP